MKSCRELQCCSTKIYTYIHTYTYVHTHTHTNIHACMNAYTRKIQSHSVSVFAGAVDTGMLTHTLSLSHAWMHGKTTESNTMWEPLGANHKRQLGCSPAHAAGLKPKPE
jgi:hypothetical protein